MVPGEIGILPEYRRGYRNPSGVNGPHGPKVEKRRGGQGLAARPLPSSPNWTRRGAAPPFPSLSLSLSLSLFPPPVNPIPTRFGGNPTPGGSRTPWRAPSRPAAPSPLSHYIRGQGGTPRTH